LTIIYNITTAHQPLHTV